MRIPFQYLKQLVAVVKKDHKHFDYDEIVIENENGPRFGWVARGVYDCPPTYFQYRRGAKPDGKSNWIKEPYKEEE